MFWINSHKPLGKAHSTDIRIRYTGFVYWIHQYQASASSVKLGQQHQLPHNRQLEGGNEVRHAQCLAEPLALGQCTRKGGFIVLTANLIVILWDNMSPNNHKKTHNKVKSLESLGCHRECHHGGEGRKAQPVSYCSEMFSDIGMTADPRQNRSI